MKKTTANPSLERTHKATEKSAPTVVWGTEVEADDFVKVPRTVLRLARYAPSAKLKPRHMVLLLTLASRRFKEKRIRAYWEELGDDLGVSKDTVRKWAYELKRQGVLKILPHRGRDQEHDRVGFRNERNEFDLSPFIELCKEAFGVRKKDRERVTGGET